jgi:hypothetical protein
MGSTRRLTALLIPFALAPFLMGVGGFAPQPPAPEQPKTEFFLDVEGDFHMAAGDPIPTGGVIPADITPGAKEAQAQLRDTKKGTLLSSATFKILPTFVLFRGCDTSLSEARFLLSVLGSSLPAWIPPSALQLLFLPVGITVDAGHVPIATEVVSQDCHTDPRHPAVIADGGDMESSTPGRLRIRLRVKILLPGAVGAP